MIYSLAEMRKNAFHRSTLLLMPIFIASVLSCALFHHIGSQVPYNDLKIYNNDAKVIALGDRVHAMKLAKLREHCEAYLRAFHASRPSSALSLMLIAYFLLRNRHKNGTKKRSLYLTNGMLIAVIIALSVEVGIEVTAIVQMVWLEYQGAPQKEIRNLLIKVQELHLNGTRALEMKYQCCGVRMKSGKLSLSTTCPFNNKVSECTTTIPGSLLGFYYGIPFCIMAAFLVLPCFLLFIRYCYKFYKMLCNAKPAKESRNENEEEELASTSSTRS